ncbi:MAG: transporter substrate-binding domain-containing protein [Chitinispirillia bacterium]|nr:transporter substrate-binding domain-containing protein [Chitinispirillia bacterium]MCL2242498.1 transporter substrate-binding domain-containing protein [Chitinispirillia bacterium]
MTKKTAVKIAVTAALALMASIAGCGKDKPDGAKTGAEQTETPRSFKAEDFADKTFAVLSGSSFDVVAREIIGTTMCRYYNTPLEVFEAVKSGAADAALMEEPVARKFAAQDPQIIALFPPADIENYAYIFPKNNVNKLRDEFNAFLTKIRGDNTYNDMVKRWIDSPESPSMPEITLNPVKDKKLTFATSDCDPPFSFKTPDGKLEGFDVELAKRFAQDAGYDIDIKVMEFPDIIPAVQSGRLDFASNLITITEERKMHIDFSEPYYYGGTVVVTKR